MQDDFIDQSTENTDYIPSDDLTFSEENETTEDAGSYKPHILLYVGPGAAGKGIPILISLLLQHNCKVSSLTTLPSKNELTLDNYDLILFPGGSARKQLSSIGQDGIKVVRSFVESGGGYVGICAGAFMGSVCCHSTGFELLSVPHLNHDLFKNRADLLGTITLSLQDNAISWKSKPQITFETECHFHNGAIFPRNLPASITQLATIKAGIGGMRKTAVMRSKSTIIYGKYGQGTVVLCGPHPEQTTGLEEFTWQMILKAIPDKGEKYDTTTNII